MAKEAGMVDGRRGLPWRGIGWGMGALLLLLPLVAMQFTGEVMWSVGDFVFAFLLIGGVGLAFELTVRATRNIAYRAGIGSALAATFLIIWATGAVGMVGDEGDPHNLLFLCVIVLALGGAVVARFRAAGMALAMAVAAVAHLAVSLGGLSIDPRGGILSATFAVLWALSAILFRAAARAKTSDR